MQSYYTEWGEGATDNAPHDIAYAYATPLGELGWRTYEIDGADSFYCYAEDAACDL